MSAAVSNMICGIEFSVTAMVATSASTLIRVIQRSLCKPEVWNGVTDPRKPTGQHVVIARPTRYTTTKLLPSSSIDRGK
jgi:hypothetical protein